MSRKANFAARKWLPALGAVLLVPLAVGAYLCRPVNAVREFGLSTPPVPSPNAHDLYLEAVRSIKAEPVDDVLDYSIGSVGYVIPAYPLAAREKWLRKNAHGFDLFQKALRAEYLFPPVRSSQENGKIDAPYEFRQLAKYKVVESRIFGTRRQPQLAVDSALDIWEFGIEAGQGTPLTPALNAVAVEIYARQALGEVIAHLNGSQAAAAARRLEGLLAKRVSYEAILREERAATLVQQKAAYEKTLYDEKQNAEFKARMERGDYGTTYFDTGPAPAQNGPLVNFTIRRLSRQYASGMDGLVETAGVTWPKRPAASAGNPNDATAKLIAATERSRFLLVRANAAGQLSLARLALHAYRKDNGVYPVKLDQLVPKYLQSVPRDPFSDGQSLLYRQDGKRYKLWSVGPDAKDDGGRHIENPNPPRPSSRFLLNPDSSGDMVANINDRVISPRNASNPSP